MAPRSQSKSMHLPHRGPPTALQPARAPCAMTTALPAWALPLKHSLGLLRSRGCSQGHYGPCLLQA